MSSNSATQYGSTLAIGSVIIIDALTGPRVAIINRETRCFWFTRFYRIRKSDLRVMEHAGRVITDPEEIRQFHRSAESKRLRELLIEYIEGLSLERLQQLLQACKYQAYLAHSFLAKLDV